MENRKRGLIEQWGDLTEASQQNLSHLIWEVGYGIAFVIFITALAISQVH